MTITLLDLRRPAIPAQRIAAQLPPVQRLLTAVLHLEEAGYDAVALSTRTADGWRSLTFAELRRRSAGLAVELIHAGVRTGDRVAILAEPGDGWVTALFGIWRAGAVVVPLDRSLTTAELRPILDDAGAVGVLASPAYADRVSELQADVVSLTYRLDLDDARLADLAGSTDGPIDTDRLRGDGDVAIVVYTSGTTGRPKGVALSFGNLLHQVRGLVGSQQLGPDNVFLSLLPLSHMLELTCGLLSPLAIGARVCYSPTLHPHEVAELIREQQVTRMVVVPLFLRMLQKSIVAQVRGSAPAVQRAFAAAHRVAERLPVPARRALFGTVHRRLGGRLGAFYCGGAPLDADVAGFFERLGFGVLQGYGLTETSPVVAMNAPAARRRGSVGRPMPGVSVAIGDGRQGQPGEVLVAGPCVMQGYFGDPQRTDEAIDGQGWLHTGDLGRVDVDGYLYITGRAKNLIVLDSGKKVQPEEVEHPLEASDLVAEVCVLSRRRVHGGSTAEQVCAVVVPSEQAKRDHIDPGALQAVIEAELAERLRTLAPYKRPASVVLHPTELPKTTTRKVLRAQVAAWLTHQED